MLSLDVGSHGRKPFGLGGALSHVAAVGRPFSAYNFPATDRTSRSCLVFRPVRLGLGRSGRRVTLLPRRQETCWHAIDPQSASAFSRHPPRPPFPRARPCGSRPAHRPLSTPSLVPGPPPVSGSARCRRRRVRPRPERNPTQSARQCRDQARVGDHPRERNASLGYHFASSAGHGEGWLSVRETWRSGRGRAPR